MAHQFELSVPAKTFLLGEYLAVKGGPSLLLTTEPRFKLRFGPAAKAELRGVHESSPAGKFYAAKSRSLKGLAFEFEDPYEGLGGLGASSAQFALLYVTEVLLREGTLDPAQMEWQKVLADYRAYAWSSRGEAPSGADLVAQLCGGLVHYDGVAYRARVLEWPFEDHNILLFRTGHKLATHEHLLKKFELNIAPWRETVARAEQALVNASVSEFIAAFGDFSSKLDAAGFVAPETKELLQALNTDEELLARGLLGVKGCGAMGADIIAILVKGKIEPWLEAKPGSKLGPLVGGTHAISTGLRVEEIGS